MKGLFPPHCFYFLNIFMILFVFFYPKTYVFHVGTSSIVTCRITLWFSSYRFWIFLLSLHLHFFFFICFCNLESVHHLLALVCCLYEGYWLLCIGFITQHFVKFSYYGGFSIHHFEVSGCTIMLFINRYGFNSSFQILTFLFIFSYLLSLSNISTIKLKDRRDNVYPCSWF